MGLAGPYAAPMKLSHVAQTTESSAIRDLLRHADRPGVLSLAGGLPSAAMFPVEAIRDAANSVLGAGIGLQYGLSEGDTRLRNWIVEQRSTIDPDLDISRVVVTTGSQQALDLLARVLIDPGDVVVVGDPCYVGARQVLGAAQADLVGVAVDHDGLVVDDLADRLAAGLRPKLVYVVANFDNPSGAVLAAERRVELVELAVNYDFLIIEDDPYSALRYEGEALSEIGPASQRVVRLRTVSKTLAPGLRVGWLIAPSWVSDAVVIAKQAVDLHTSTVSQAIAAELVTQPEFLDRHIGQLRPFYRRQRDALADALDEQLPQAQFRRPDGGMFVWLRLEGIDSAALLTKALEVDVAFVPGSAFAVQRDLSDYLRLSFATVEASKMTVAVARLAQVVPTP